MSQGLHRLKDGLAKLMGERGYGYSLSAEACDDAWKHAVGELFYHRTQVGALRRKVLEITVADSVSMQELTFRKSSILATLQKNLPDFHLQDIRFRIGHVPPLSSQTENQE
jgi:hypothetical protein